MTEKAAPSTNAGRPRTAGWTGASGYLEDFEVGQRMRHARGATIGELENNLLAKLVMNTAQTHWNRHWRAQTAGHFPFENDGVVVMGPAIAAMVFGLASQDTVEQAVRELGCSGLRVLASPQVGDTLYAFTEVLAVEDYPQDPHAGVVRFKHWGATQDGTVVFEGIREALIPRRSAQ